MNINKVLQIGREALLKSRVDPREARLLLAFAMKLRNEELLLYNECSDEQYIQYMKLVNRRITGEPFAYIVGHKEFMRLDFKVDKNVLIPREDTEILVQEIIRIANEREFMQEEHDKSNNIESYKENKKIKILDMCTGSGCIAISLAKYVKNSELLAVDISENALAIARENATNNHVNIKFSKSDLFENVLEKFDIIVSNPPYIKSCIIENLQEEVKKEPMLALDGGESGLNFYKKITREATNFLNKDGILAFEIGFDQGEDVSKIMKENKFKNIEIKKDISGNERIVVGKV